MDVHESGKFIFVIGELRKINKDKKMKILFQSKKS